MSDAEIKLHQIRGLVVGVGRTGRRNNGMDMLADAVLRILDQGPLDYPGECQTTQKSLDPVVEQRLDDCF